MFTSHNWVRPVILFAATLLILRLPQPFPEHLAKVDFQAYWGASYLLSQSENFADGEKLLQVQHQFTGWTEESAQMTWNPPWLLAWLLPYTLVEFNQASWLWFLTNISLLFASTWVMWQLFAQKAKTKEKMGIGLLITFFFVPTLTLLLVGQITTLVLFGLVLFLYFFRQNRFFLAGSSLSLVTIKPHLLYITLPFLLLHLVWHKQWRTLTGFALPILLGTLVALALRPTFPWEYAATMGESSLLRLTVPTLGYFLSTVFGWSGFRLMGVIILPMVLLYWYRHPHKQRLNLVIWSMATLLLSIITSPFGWSFDMVLLLMPVQYGVVNLVERRVGIETAVVVTLLFTLCNLIMLYQRTLEVWDDKFFWFPIALGMLYAAIYRHERKRAF